MRLTAAKIVALLAICLAAPNTASAWKPRYISDPIEAFSSDSSKFLRILRPPYNNKTPSVALVSEWKSHWDYVIRDSIWIDTDYFPPNAMISDDGMYWVLVGNRIHNPNAHNQGVHIRIYSCDSLPIIELDDYDIFPLLDMFWFQASYEIVEGNILTIRAPQRYQQNETPKYNVRRIRLSDGEFLY